MDRNKEERVHIRLTERERKALLRNAKKRNMSVSAYVRAQCIYSLDNKLPVIDTAPIGNAVSELHEIGISFNRLVANFGKHGPNGYNSKHANLVMDEIGNAVSKVQSGLQAMIEDAAQHGLQLRTERDEEDEF